MAEYNKGRGRDSMRMTVRDLKKALDKFDDNCEVCIALDSSYGSDYNLYSDDIKIIDNIDSITITDVNAESYD